MKETPPREGPLPSRDLVAVTDEHVAASVEALGTVIEDIKAGNFGPTREMASVLAGLRKALEAALHERARIAKLNPGADAPEPALDLDAARHEIGRRLACLRAAGDGGALPGEPE